MSGMRWATQEPICALKKKETRAGEDLSLLVSSEAVQADIGSIEAAVPPGARVVSVEIDQVLQGQADWEASLATLSWGMELAVNLGAQSLTIGAPSQEGWASRGYFVEWMSEALTEFLRLDDTGVVLLLRNRLDAGNSFDCIELCQYVRRSRIGIAFDAAASVQACDGYIDGVLRAVRPWLHVIHLAEVDSAGNDVSPGIGEIPVKRVIQFLHNSDYRGTITAASELRETVQALLAD